MFLLVIYSYGERTVKGVFPSVHMAKKFVLTKMRREVEWSEPNADTGVISADLGDGDINIEPGSLNPKK
jgi:hypothetical protein